MALPADSPETTRSEPDVGWAGACALAAVLLYSLPFVAVGGYVFYASIRPVTIATGYFAVVIDWPWMLAWVALLAAWAGGPVILLVLGLIHLLQHSRHRWRSAARWLVLLVAGAAVGFVIIHDYRLLFRASPVGPDGSELGPSRWAPGAPYWQALFLAGGQLAVGVVMAALITAPVRRKPRPLAARHIGLSRRRSMQVTGPAEDHPPSLRWHGAQNSGATATKRC